MQRGMELVNEQFLELIILLVGLQNVLLGKRPTSHGQGLKVQYRGSHWLAEVVSAYIVGVQSSVLWSYTGNPRPQGRIVLEARLLM
jgi:hypothetical protein